MIEEEARGFFDAGNFDESISKYQELLELSPEWWAVDAYTKIGFMLAQQGKPEDSVRIYREVLEFNDEAELKENVHHIHLSLGIALQRMAQHEEAREHLQLAVDGYEKEVLDKPRSRPPLEQLGDTYAALASWSEAAEVFAKTLTLDPANMTNQLKASRWSNRDSPSRAFFASCQRPARLPGSRMLYRLVASELPRQGFVGAEVNVDPGCAVWRIGSVRLPQRLGPGKQDA